MINENELIKETIKGALLYGINGYLLRIEAMYFNQNSISSEELSFTKKTLNKYQNEILFLENKLAKESITDKNHFKQRIEEEIDKFLKLINNK